MLISLASWKTEKKNDTKRLQKRYKYNCFVYRKPRNVINIMVFGPQNAETLQIQLFCVQQAPKRYKYNGFRHTERKKLYKYNGSGTFYCFFLVFLGFSWFFLFFPGFASFLVSGPRGPHGCDSTGYAPQSPLWSVARQSLVTVLKQVLQTPGRPHTTNEDVLQ